jgi:alcohol dehydrogenase class IV
MNFEFATANRIIFGVGRLYDLGPIAAEMGRRALVVIGGTSLRAAALFDVLRQQQVHSDIFQVIGEPTVEMVQEGVLKARRSHCDLVIGCGGGSVIDAGKAIAALLTNPGQALDYLEVIGQGRQLTQPPLPYIAVPTTAGTGAEVTRNAVLGSPQHRIKVSLRSPLMLPKLALIDPELTLTMPPPVTATTGLDALTQVLEPYVCNQTNPLTDAFCLDGLHRVARSLRAAYHDGDDLRAREDMVLASLEGGLALANAKLGAVHGFAGPFGGLFDAPHGGVCAALLSGVMEVNLAALMERAPGSPALDRYADIAQILTDDPSATAAAGVAWVAALCRDLQIPGLGAYGLTEADFPDLIAKAQQASSMKGNPIQLTVEELEEILKKAM